MKLTETTTKTGVLYISASELRLVLTQYNPKLRGLIDHSGLITVATSIGTQKVDGIMIDTNKTTDTREVDL